MTVGDGGRWIRRQCLVLSQNYHTPVSFWLSETYAGLTRWIRDSNELVEEQNKK